MTRWVAAAGAFVVSLDSTVNIAFPAIAATFALSPEQVRWVIVCYVLTYALMSFVGGTLADGLGHERIFRAGVAGSALGFLLSATAPRFGWLLVGRVVQGIAGGFVYGTAPGIITLAAAPHARGRALGFLNAAIGFAFALGPLAAGVLVEALGWRAVFYLRIPLALATLVWAGGGARAPRAVGAPRLGATRHVLRPRVLHAGLLAFIANAGIFAIWWLAPFYLVTHRGLGARLGGVLFMLTPLGTALGAPLAGRAADRVGARLPTIAGLVLESGALAALSQAGQATALVPLGVALFAAGFGLGVFQVPNMAVVMSAFPRAEQGAGGGFAFLARTLGVVVGVATFARVFALWRAAGFDPAFRVTFLVAAAGVAVAALVALVPGGGDAKSGPSV